MLDQHLGDRTSPDNESNFTNPGYVLGADIGGTNLRLALANLSGTIVAKWSTSTEGIRSADTVVDLIHQGAGFLLQHNAAPHNPLLAIGAGAPGITDTDQGVVIATSYLMGWRNVPLRMLLEKALGVPAAIENDVNLAAIGERHAGAAQGIDDFIFIAVGTGVGAGIILNGKLFRGSNWTAGEIGYMLVPGASEEPAERGQPGALERLIGGTGIKTLWQARWSQSHTSLPKEASATQIFDEAAKGNPLASELLHLCARTLSYAIYNASLLLNCPLFVLGGGVGIHPALIQATQNLLNQRSARGQPHIVASALGPDAQLVGAISLALETATVRTLAAVR